MGSNCGRGGDVKNCRLRRTGADAALVGERPARYRYTNITVTNHDPGGTGYVGTWGYDSQSPVRLLVHRSTFRKNPRGGLYLPTRSSIGLEGTASPIGAPSCSMLAASC